MCSDLRPADPGSARTRSAYSVRGSRGMRSPQGPGSRLRSSHPAVARMTRGRPHRQVLLACPGDVVRRETGKLHQLLERVGDERLEGLWYGTIDAARRRAGARQAVQARGIEAEKLPLGGFGELGIAPAFPHLLGDLEAPEGIDLPLR